MISQLLPCTSDTNGKSLLEIHQLTLLTPLDGAYVLMTQTMQLFIAIVTAMSLLLVLALSGLLGQWILLDCMYWAI
jgi:hypothetical protein